MSKISFSKTILVMSLILSILVSLTIQYKVKNELVRVNNMVAYVECGSTHYFSNNNCYLKPSYNDSNICVNHYFRNEIFKNDNENDDILTKKYKIMDDEYYNIARIPISVVRFVNINDKHVSYKLYYGRVYQYNEPDYNENMRTCEQVNQYADSQYPVITYLNEHGLW